MNTQRGTWWERAVQEEQETEGGGVDVITVVDDGATPSEVRPPVEAVSPQFTS